MKGNQILGIGLLVLSITIIASKIFNLPDIVQMIFLLIAIFLEVIAVFKMKKEK